MPLVNGDPQLTSGALTHATFVCLHGLGDRKEAYRHLLPLLADAGAEVVSIDAPGHGASTAAPPSSAADVARSLEEAVSAVDGPCVLVAHSAGAAPAAAVAAARPHQVRTLVLLAPVLDTAPDGIVSRVAMHTVMRSLPLWTLYYRGMFRGRRPADLATHLAAVRAGLRGRMRSVSGFFRGRQALTARLSGLQGRHLAILGGADPAGGDPAAVAQRLRALSPLASWDVRSIPGAGHCPHQDSPEDVARAVIDFLQADRLSHQRSP